MNRNIKRSLISILCVLLTLCLALPISYADSVTHEDFLVLGANLSESQKEKVLGLLGVKDASSMYVVTVTIQDERALLGSLVSQELIGSRSLSSARITLTEEGSGIQVTTHNISSISSTMYSSALITAGVSDAKVIIAAPIEVSGTAALAGIFKAYEMATNVTLDDVAKLVASEELLLSGELAEFIGSDEAVRLIAELKAMVIENGWDNEETIRPAVLQTMKDLNIQLTDDQVSQVVSLLLKFCQLDMDPQDIANQLQGIVKTIQGAASVQSAVTGFFSKVGEFFVSVGHWFRGLFGF